MDQNVTRCASCGAWTYGVTTCNYCVKGAKG
jgi:hypothetical protein